ncbi:MAG: UV DNA damage repair endonuclease UvsE [Firmicutes bacterium]|nr:UV DNA damage repair endonuclease UvsE [Bacillota bacterium]
MIIRLGYVAMAIDLKKCSPSKTITYKTYKKIKDEEVKLYKLKKVAKQNIINTKRILLYNAAHNIKVYRISSKLIPLVTHDDVINWDYVNEFKDIYRDIKRIIKDNNLRVSAHPDHYTIISSPKEDVVKSSLQILDYHKNIMETFGLDCDHGKLVLHMGGKYGDKNKTLNRFKENFIKLNPDIKKRIILENDDKIYGVSDLINICEDLSIPLVLDIHHHWCNNNGDNIENYLQRIFDSWSKEKLKPKIHISSPKSETKKRAHAEEIDFDFFNDFIKKAKVIDRDFDIMIEAKNKNLALFNLMKEIKKHKEYKIINESTFEI